MKNITYSIFLFLFSFSTSSAAHILSGNIGYECLGNGDYIFTIEMERDCYSGGATFDDQINVAIYSEGILLHDLNIGRGPIIDVVSEDYENCVPTDFEVCREETSYIFQVNLPVIDKTYTIAHQRCCWSEIIGNILNPGETGITITTDLTPLAQSICHSQEISSVPISFLACPNTEVNIDLPLQDSEGDSLVYEVCLPYRGGGFVSATGGNPNGCLGITPMPACPPPYEELEFAPGYDYDNPFPTVDGFNFSNGVLQFTPSTLGHFLTGLCISEYRNGELLSSKQVPLAVVSEIPSSSSTEEISAAEWSIEKLSTTHLSLQSSIISRQSQFSLYDISGKQFYLETTDTVSGKQLNIAELNSGIYLIKIDDERTSQTIRFFKP